MHARQRAITTTTVHPVCALEGTPLNTKLTDRAVLNYKPGAKRRRIRDALAKSLFLVIEPSGTKSWQMRFRTPSGRIGKLTLGRVDFSGRELQGDPSRKFQPGMGPQGYAVHQPRSEEHTS